MSSERWVLVRHGETAWNEAGRLQGRSDVRLNALGRQQAEKAGVQLAKEGRWDLVVCSPLATCFSPRAGRAARSRCGTCAEASRSPWIRRRPTR